VWDRCDRSTGSSIYDESRYADEISIPESWRVRAGDGYVILEAAEDKDAIDDGEDSWKLSTLFLLALYDKSG